jgi:hypothetical protein
MHCGKKDRYSITSSATERTPGGIDAERSRRMKVDDKL